MLKGMEAELEKRFTLLDNQWNGISKSLPRKSVEDLKNAIAAYCRRYKKATWRIDVGESSVRIMGFYSGKAEPAVNLRYDIFSKTVGREVRSYDISLNPIEL